MRCIIDDFSICGLVHDGVKIGDNYIPICTECRKEMYFAESLEDMIIKLMNRRRSYFDNYATRTEIIKIISKEKTIKSFLGKYELQNCNSKPKMPLAIRKV